MQLRDLTTELQTHCHNGDSECNTVIKVLDAFYKIKKIKTEHTGTGKKVFIIEAE